MRFTFSLSLLLSVLPFLTSCGFRDGWGEDEDVRSDKTAEQYCEETDGFSWVDGKCQKDIFLLDDGNLTETECKKLKEAYWFDGNCSNYSKLSEDACVSFSELIWHGEVCSIKAKVECEAAGKFYDESKCVDRPVVTFTGALKQNVASGGQLEPIAYEVSQGAVLAIKDTTCEGFFQLNDGKIGSDPEYKIAANKQSCEATLVALQRKIESVPQVVVADFSTGFLSYCNDSEVEGSIFYVIKELIKISDKTTCSAAAEVLTNSDWLEIPGNSRISRLEPFSGLNNLRGLEIRGHSIANIPASIASLGSLRWLDLSNGKITDISPLAGSKTIKDLFLDGNPIAIPANRTEENCPTKAGTNDAVKAFCLKTP